MSPGPFDRPNRIAVWVSPAAALTTVSSVLSVSSSPAAGAAVEVGLDVERDDVEVAAVGEDDPLQDAQVAHRVIPASCSPSRKWGRSWLSNIESADPIAMCMSRYW